MANTVTLTIQNETLRDILQAAAKGIRYWADVKDLRRRTSGELDAVLFLVRDEDVDTLDLAQCRRADWTDMAIGLQRLANYALGTTRQAGISRPRAMAVFAEAANGDVDADAADIVFQFAVFGELRFQ